MPQKAGILDRVYNSTIGIPQQLLWRIWRAIEEEKLSDIFSEKGLLDPALIPFLGAFDEHEHDVMPDYMSEQLGFGKGWGGELAASILTDPITFLTAGLTAAGKAAKGANMARQTKAVRDVIDRSANFGKMKVPGGEVLKGSPFFPKAVKAKKPSFKGVDDYVSQLTVDDYLGVIDTARNDALKLGAKGQDQINVLDKATNAIRGNIAASSVIPEEKLAKELSDQLKLPFKGTAKVTEEIAKPSIAKVESTGQLSPEQFLKKMGKAQNEIITGESKLADLVKQTAQRKIAIGLPILASLGLSKTVPAAFDNWWQVLSHSMKSTMYKNANKTDQSIRPLLRPLAMLTHYTASVPWIRASLDEALAIPRQLKGGWKVGGEPRSALVNSEEAITDQKFNLLKHWFDAKDGGGELAPVIAHHGRDNIIDNFNAALDNGVVVEDAFSTALKPIVKQIDRLHGESIATIWRRLSGQSATADGKFGLPKEITKAKSLFAETIDNAIGSHETAQKLMASGKYSEQFEFIEVGKLANKLSDERNNLTTFSRGLGTASYELGKKLKTTYNEVFQTGSTTGFGKEAKNTLASDIARGNDMTESTTQVVYDLIRHHVKQSNGAMSLDEYLDIEARLMEMTTLPDELAHAFSMAKINPENAALVAASLDNHLQTTRTVILPFKSIIQGETKVSNSVLGQIANNFAETEIFQWIPKEDDFIDDVFFKNAVDYENIYGKPSWTPSQDKRMGLTHNRHTMYGGSYKGRQVGELTDTQLQQEIKRMRQEASIAYTDKDIVNYYNEAASPATTKAINEFKQKFNLTDDEFIRVFQRKGKGKIRQIMKDTMVEHPLWRNKRTWTFDEAGEALDAFGFSVEKAEHLGLEIYSSPKRTGPFGNILTAGESTTKDIFILRPNKVALSTAMKKHGLKLETPTPLKVRTETWWGLQEAAERAARREIKFGYVQPTDTQLRKFIERTIPEIPGLQEAKETFEKQLRSIGPQPKARADRVKYAKKFKAETGIDFPIKPLKPKKPAKSLMEAIDFEQDPFGPPRKPTAPETITIDGVAHRVVNAAHRKELKKYAVELEKYAQQKATYKEWRKTYGRREIKLTKEAEKNRAALIETRFKAMRSPLPREKVHYIEADRRVVELPHEFLGRRKIELSRALGLKKEGKWGEVDLKALEKLKKSAPKVAAVLADNNVMGMTKAKRKAWLKAGGDKKLSAILSEEMGAAKPRYTEPGLKNLMKSVKGFLSGNPEWRQKFGPDLVPGRAKIELPTEELAKLKSVLSDIDKRIINSTVKRPINKETGRRAEPMRHFVESQLPGYGKTIKAKTGTALDYNYMMSAQAKRLYSKENKLKEGMPKFEEANIPKREIEEVVMKPLDPEMDIYKQLIGGKDGVSVLGKGSEKLKINGLVHDYLGARANLDRVYRFLKMMKQKGITNPANEFDKLTPTLIKLEESLNGITTKIEDIVVQQLPKGLRHTHEIAKKLQRVQWDEARRTGIWIPGAPVGYLGRYFTREGRQQLNTILGEMDAAGSDILTRIGTKLPEYHQRDVDSMSIDMLEEIYGDIERKVTEGDPNSVKWQKTIDKVMKKEGYQIKGIKDPLPWSGDRLEKDPFLSLMQRMQTSEQSESIEKYVNNMIADADGTNGRSLLSGAKVTHVFTDKTIPDGPAEGWLGGLSPQEAQYTRRPLEVTKARKLKEGGEAVEISERQALVSKNEPTWLVLEKENGSRKLIHVSMLENTGNGILPLGAAGDAKTLGYDPTVALSFVRATSRSDLHNQFITGKGAHTKFNDLLGQNVLYGSQSIVTGMAKQTGNMLKIAPAYLRTYDSINYTIKKFQTVFRIPFQIYNLQSGVFQSSLTGISPKNLMGGYVNTLQMLWGESNYLKHSDLFLQLSEDLPGYTHEGGGFPTVLGKSDVISAIRRFNPKLSKLMEEPEHYELLQKLGIDVPADGVIPLGAGREQPFKEFAEAANEYQLYGTFASMMTKGSRTADAQLIRLKLAALDPNLIKRWYTGATDLIPKALGARPGQAREATEIINRTAMALGLRREGYDLKTAISMTKAAHVPYERLTRIEQDYLKRHFLFYTFPRHYMPWAWSKFMEEPGRLSNLSHMVRTQKLFTADEGRAHLKIGDYRVDVSRLNANVEAAMFLHGFMDRIAMPVGKLAGLGESAMYPHDPNEMITQASDAGLMSLGGAAGLAFPGAEFLKQGDRSAGGSGDFMSEARRIIWPSKMFFSLMRQIGVDNAPPSKEERSPFIQYTPMEKIISDTDFGLGIRKVRPKHEQMRAINEYKAILRKMKLRLAATQDPKMRVRYQTNLDTITRAFQGMLEAAESQAFK